MTAGDLLRLSKDEHAMLAEVFDRQKFETEAREREARKNIMKKEERFVLGREPVPLICSTGTVNGDEKHNQGAR